jgi:nucleotidyltransferase substrate binding protein (TIGR01987 family)
VDNPVRWKQRFANFEKAYAQMNKILALPELGEIEKVALIKTFEFTFELSWNTLKDYLEEGGFEPKNPKEVLRQAFQSELIKQGEIWMEALKKRNDSAHNYDSKIMEETVVFIRDQFYPQLRDWYHDFKKESRK